MRPMDMSPNRSLDRDNGRAEDTRPWPRVPDVPDGRARSPAELLDNLRLRLLELPDNHPSAPRTVDRQESSDRAANANRAMPSDQPEPHDRADRSGPAERPDHQKPDDDVAFGDTSDVAMMNLVDRAGPAMNLADRAGRAEAYLPWFMSGEPATPWWAAEADPWAE
jgi:hypothetical protein